MKSFIFICLFVSCFSSFALEYPPHVVSWVENNVSNIGVLEEREKQPIYHIVNAFYSRLSNWQKHKPFYDQLYQNPEIAKKYPVFIDVSEGLYIVVLLHFQKITDLPPYRALRGKTIEQVFGYSEEAVEQVFGHSGILMDEADGEATRQTLIIQKRGLSKCATGTFNLFYHEFAHLLHLTLLFEEEFWSIEELYKSAVEKGHYLDDYAATHPAEYFAQGLEAYFSVSKPLDYPIPFKHTRQDLENKDPKLLAFIESLIDDSWSLKDFKMTCHNLTEKEVIVVRRNQDEAPITRSRDEDPITMSRDEDRRIPKPKDGDMTITISEDQDRIPITRSGDEDPITMSRDEDRRIPKPKDGDMTITISEDTE